MTNHDAILVTTGRRLLELDEVCSFVNHHDRFGFNDAAEWGRAFLRVPAQ